MAFDSFLKIDGIDGESQTQGHEKWIELLSFSWGATAATSVSSAPTLSTAGAVAGRSSPQAFAFTKVTDSASPTIFQKLCLGTLFSKVSVACRKAGGDSVDAAGAPGDDFVKMDFFDVFFLSYNEGGNAATDPRPLESISFAFAKVVYQAAPVLADGSLGAAVTGGFDFRMNRAS